VVVVVGAGAVVVGGEVAVVVFDVDGVLPTVTTVQVPPSLLMF
jgi:hypothetical protein